MYQDAKIINVTLSLNAGAYTANDVLADFQEIPDFVRRNGGIAKIISFAVVDEDDQAAAAMDFYFADAAVSLGTENDVVSITDAHTRSIIGKIAVASTDFEDLINAKAAFLNNVNLLIKAADSTNSIWIGATTAGTPTQTASGIRVRIGVEQT